ncbi:hypothetical protein [Roseofilum sp. Guam]|uniref:hypothetical protein n=1 Tax=Roseofilum sp. Guam TaxID=2821502 RepID=UPI001B0D9624|nr:hypothetical protein [Roseofilum sp. Guam]MBP0027487.1 hypothetical protein [Roseofilum sp. Guam]
MQLIILLPLGAGEEWADRQKMTTLKVWPARDGDRTVKWKVDFNPTLKFSIVLTVFKSSLL